MTSIAWTDEDVSTGLARTYRWGGHSRWDLPLSVAQHSLTVLRIREAMAGRALTAAERLRELAHDMEEGLLHLDAIAPLKPHLGKGYDGLVCSLRCVIQARYGLPPCRRDAHDAHKQADRLAAASEAKHVVGWADADTPAEAGLTTSAGVSYNKLLAKLASDHRKPDGLFVIMPRMGPAFVEALPVGKFHGIGPKTAARMNALGIHTGLDLRGQSRAFLAEHFGRAGDYLHGVARGVDERPVQADRARKSVGAETTFERDLLRWDEVAPALHPVFAKVWAASTRGGHRGPTVTVKAKHADFGQVTRSRSCPEPVATQAELERISLGLLRPLFPPRLGVRLLGVALSDLDAEAAATGAAQGGPAQLALGLG